MNTCVSTFCMHHSMCVCVCVREREGEGEGEREFTLEMYDSKLLI